MLNFAVDGNPSWYPPALFVEAGVWERVNYSSTERMMFLHTSEKQRMTRLRDPSRECKLGDSKDPTEREEKAKTGEQREREHRDSDTHT